MKKMSVLVLTIALLLPLGALAQGKIAFVNTQEILMAMPELTEMEKKLADLNETYTKELEMMRSEYDKKYQSFISQQDSLTENIKLRRMQELQDMQQRMENVYQMAQSDVPKKQEELYQPIQQKMMDAIKAVGKENGYTYMLNPGAILFTGEDAIDATVQVKAKLKLP